MIQSYIFVFFPALIVELIRSKLLPFSKLLIVNFGGQQKDKSSAQRE